MRWFRLYTDILDDPKCNVSNMPDETFRTFIMLMAYASELEKDGKIFPENDPAWRLRISQSDLEKHLSTLLLLEIIELKKGIISFKNWDKRQFASDNSTERVKRFRNGQRNVSVTADETPPETESETESESETEGVKHLTPSEQFDLFWKQYPRKEKKKNALEAWSKLKLNNEQFFQVSAALAKQKMSDQWTRDGGKYIPHPTTWINGRRWEDEGIQKDYAETPSSAPASKFEKNMAVLDKALEETKGEKNNGGQRNDNQGFKSLGYDVPGKECERGVRENLSRTFRRPTERGICESDSGVPFEVPVLPDDSGD